MKTKYGIMFINEAHKKFKVCSKKDQFSLMSQSEVVFTCILLFDNKENDSSTGDFL
jgi:hypothetical protein